jgi:salicylate hydroxylase
MFHRFDMHAMLMDSATGVSYQGTPTILQVNHKCVSIDHSAGEITFQNGLTSKHDLIIGADGIGSTVRTTLGMIPDRKQSTLHCLHCIITTEDVKRLGLNNYASNEAIDRVLGRTSN